MNIFTLSNIATYIVEGYKYEGGYNLECEATKKGKYKKEETVLLGKIRNRTVNPASYGSHLSGWETSKST